MDKDIEIVRTIGSWKISVLQKANRVRDMKPNAINVAHIHLIGKAVSPTNPAVSM